MSNCKVIALTNQKGGVGKTTTAVNLGVCLSKQGKKVLLVDADAQANLTMSLGYPRPDDLPISLATIMQDIIDDKPFDVQKGILHHSEGVDLLPSNIELSGLEVRLINAISRERVLTTCINEVKKNYDYVLIDCMPSLGMLTINALAAADSVVIPTQPHYLSAKGLELLLRSVSKVRRQINPHLRIDGILMTMVMPRTNISKEVTALVRSAYGQNIKVFDAQIPHSIRAVEATAIRYVVPASQTAPIEWNKVTNRSFQNILKKFNVTVTKTDAETGTPQGDASLAGAVYGIYKGEELIDTYTTDENGQFTTKYYVCGDDWTIREISPSEGYLLDPTIHKVGAEPELYEVEYNSVENDVNEQVIKGNIAIIKHTDDGETGIETPEEGAVFEVFLKSAGSFEQAKESERDKLVCDENGFAQTKDMPYGIYTVKQTSGWEGRELMKPFDVFISSDGQTYHGMNAEQFAWAYIKSEFLYPKRLLFQSEDLYHACMEETLALGEKTRGDGAALLKKREQRAKKKRMKQKKRTGRSGAFD